jgi:hypothetical protein
MMMLKSEMTLRNDIQSGARPFSSMFTIVEHLGMLLHPVGAYQ